MSKGKVFSCHCCGSEVTAPYFYKGAVYGYTCIKKVDPDHKRTKDKSVYVKADSITIKDIENSTVKLVVAMVNGVKFTERSYTENGDRCSFIMVSAGLVKIKNGKGEYCYNGIVYANDSYICNGKVIG
jgi:hypothetical protein